jgi:hypothetical protein
MSAFSRTAAFPDLIVGKSKVSGKGIFSGKRYLSGDVILEFHGWLYTHAELPNPYVEDCFLQVGPDLFLGPTDGPETSDTLVNHSCDPNAVVLIKPDGRVLMMAIRPIEPLDEITYDYSITMADDPWTMICCCGSPRCRTVIREYRTLPPEVKARYRWINVVPPYVIERDLPSPSSKDQGLSSSHRSTPES